MQYPIFFVLFLALLSHDPAIKEKTERKPLTDSINCQYGLMQTAWYSYGVDSTLPPLTDQRMDFIISVDTNCKATNFISYIEYITRNSSSNVHQSAASEHTRNNNGKHVVRILNNTPDTIFLQTQDGSIMAIMQGLTKGGQWSPIQYWMFGKCGNSYTNIGFLPKTTGAFVAQLPNRGNYVTKFRFKVLGRNRFFYSNEFTGKIDYCEFTDRSKVTRFKLDTLLRDRQRNRLYPM